MRRYSSSTAASISAEAERKRTITRGFKKEFLRGHRAGDLLTALQYERAEKFIESPLLRSLCDQTCIHLGKSLRDGGGVALVKSCLNDDEYTTRDLQVVEHHQRAEELPVSIFVLLMKSAMEGAAKSTTIRSFIDLLVACKFAFRAPCIGSPTSQAIKLNDNFFDLMNSATETAETAHIFMMEHLKSRIHKEKEEISHE